MNLSGIKTATDYQEELSNVVEIIHSEGEKYQSSSSEIKTLTGISLMSIHPSDTLSKAVNTWLTKIWRIATVANQGETNIEFSVDELDDSFLSVSETLGKRIDSYQLNGETQT